MGLVSRFEVMQQDIVNEFAQISITNGYRTDIADFIPAIRNYDQIKKNEIGIAIPSKTITGTDDIWTSFEAECDVWVRGVVFSNTTTTKDNSSLNTAIDALEQDMLKVMATIITKYIAGNATRWNVKNSPVRVMKGIDFGQQVNQGVVLINFKTHPFAMDTDFA